MQETTKKRVLFSSRSNKHILKKKKRSAKKTVLTFTVIVALLVGSYCTAVFSNISFIKKWRDMYIETAMDTYSHKWLATLFIPGFVIDGVMAGKEELLEAQQTLQSSWEPVEVSTTPAPTTSDSKLTEFLELFDELDQTSFNDYIDQHPEAIKNDYDKLLINETDLSGDGTTILTTAGHQVLAIDAENGILIMKVTGEGYVGKLAIVKDPSKVSLGVSKNLGSYGQTVQKIADNNNGVLAINASGFADDEGKGNGGNVVGLLISNGEKIHNPIRSPYLIIGFDVDDHLNIGIAIDKIDYRDAVEFVPALIVNGVNVVKDKTTDNGSMGFGLQPRTVIGQEADGTVFFLTIDGRQIGYSIGCTVVECAKILEKYGVYQASNLDGGSSTVMVYRGDVITKPANGSTFGRYVPNAFVVEYTGTPEPADD